MKKKILGFLCVITTLLSLAGCGTTEYTEVQKQCIAQCEENAEILIQVASTMGTEDYLSELTTNYKKHETAAILEYLTSSFYGITVSAEYGVFEGMLTTYIQADKDMGGIVSVGNHTSEIIGKEVVIIYDLVGNNANGTFKFTFNSDIYTKLTGAEANAKLTAAQNLKKAGGQMKNAALNTVLGMGTVFVVLILISLIISSFSLFKKADKPAPVKKEEKNETPVVEEDLTDDTELVAVIMAAISAYEGTTSTDGFVVRSIRRANRRN